MAFEEVHSVEGVYVRDPAGGFVRAELVTQNDLTTTVELTVDGRERVTVPLAVPQVDELGKLRRNADGLLSPRRTTLYDAISIAKAAAPPRTAGDAAPIPHDRNPVPILCHQHHVRPIGVCRVCTVVVGKAGKDGALADKRTVPACVYPITRDAQGLIVHTTASPDEATADEVGGHVRMLLRLLAANHLHHDDDQQPDPRHRNELLHLCERFEVVPPRLLRADTREPAGGAADPVEYQRIPLPQLPARRGYSRGSGDRGRPDCPVANYDRSSPIIVVDRNDCILCDRCVRACSDVKPFKVIGHTGFGRRAGITFDLSDRMSESGCVACGECAVACPTGALTFNPARDVYRFGAVVEEPKGEAVGPAPLRVRSRAQQGAFWDGDEFAFPVVGHDPDGPDVQNLVPLRNVGRARPKTVAASQLLDRGAPGWASVASLFEAIPYAFLRWNQGAVGLLECGPASVRLCHQGEHGSVAFLLVSGAVSVYRSPAGAPPYTRAVTFDAAADKDTILGEMACMSGQPRRGTLVAHPRAKVLVLHRNILHVLQRSGRGHDLLAGKYRDRALDHYFKNRDLFPYLTDDQRKAWIRRFPDQNREQFRFLQFSPGQVIVRQGDTADGFYLVAAGHVEVAVRDPHRGGVRVVNHLGPHQSFGELALLTELFPALRAERPDTPRGERNATVTALDHVEIVWVGRAAFEDIVGHERAVRDRLESYGRSLLAGNRLAGPERAERYAEFLRGQGLYQGQNLLVLDLHKCTRCHECVKACADSHHGDSRLYLEGDRFDRFLVPSACRSCHDPECLVGCPVDAIHRRSSGGGLAILIDDTCIGCGLCAHNCPFGSIHMIGEAEAGRPLRARLRDKDQKRMATNCDLCESLDGDPRCVRHCPHDAARRMTGNELARLVGLPVLTNGRPG
jgi:Fe-S-cluster-containing hydrogenase component 2/CRP-like cAMP-binding protein